MQAGGSGSSSSQLKVKLANAAHSKLVSIRNDALKQINALLTNDQRVSYNTWASKHLQDLQQEARDFQYVSAAAGGGGGMDSGGGGGGMGGGGGGGGGGMGGGGGGGGMGGGGGPGI